MWRNLVVVKSHSGFSLVELMVTVTILTLLVLLGASLSSVWVQRAKVHEAKTQLQQAQGIAAALAQRNAKGITGASIAAGFKVSGQSLLVCVGDPAGATCVASNATARWKSTLPAGVTIKLNDSTDTTQMLAFDNTGVARKSDGSVAGSKFEITIGGQSETGYLR